jgi:hypothetical protein
MNSDVYQNGPNPNAPWHAPSTSSIYKEYSIISCSQPKAECGRQGRLDLFRSRGTKDDGVLSADEHFILYAHAEAMKVLGELRVGWYVYAYIK